MTSVAATSQNENPDTLAVACIGHLQQEEAMLTSTLEMLQQIRAALVNRNQAALAEALEAQQRSEKSASELHASRELVRLRIGRCLGLPPAEATLKQLSQRVTGELRERLSAGRRRLAELTMEIDSVNRCNAVLVQQSMGLLNQVLFCLTGQDGSSQRYGASGQMSSGNSGSVIQCEC